MTDPQQIHRASSSLRRAIATGPDDFEHPDQEDLIALVEGRLSDADREVAQAHIAMCVQCAEDVRDITEMREQMSAQPRAVSHAWKYAVAAAIAVAAVLFLVVMLRQPQPQVVTKEASATPAPPREIALSSEEQAVVDAAIAAGRVTVPSNVSALAGSVGQLLGSTTAASALLPMSPSGTIVAVASPEFSWQPVAGAVTYRVAVFDAAFRELASSGPVKTVSWTPAVRLPSDVPLMWQVTAHMTDGSDVLAPAPPRPEARFTVLDAAAAAKMSGLRSRLADQPMALGILLAKAGLLDDAAREFERAAQQPAQADLAARLRASLRSPQ